MTLTQRLIAIQPIIAQQDLGSKIIPFGEFLPDRAALGNPGALEALNVVPTIDGYRPLGSLATQSNALTARAQGAGAAADSTGTVYVYAGDSERLYRLIFQTFTDVSRSGGYSTAADGEWEFALFGNRLVATNFDDPVQGITLGPSGNFSNLITSTNVPRARHVDVVRDFVVLGNTQDVTDGAKPERVWWSGINDELDFDPSASTQSDFNDVPEAGWCQRILGGIDYGLVFYERAIYRMTYVGSPLIFQFDAISRAVGTPIPGSVIGYGRLGFFISEYGFMMTDGVNIVPIGHRKVDRWFWDQMDIVYRSRVSAGIDPVNKLVFWAFPGTGNTNGEPNEIAIYNWLEQRFSHAQVNTERVLRSIGQGFTLDTLDSFSTDLDALPFSLDSRAWTGGDLRVAAFDTSHILNLFTGSNLQATLDTGDFQPTNGYRSRIREVRPLIDGGTITAAAASRARLTDTVSFGTLTSITTDGRCPFRSEGRYHRIRARVAAGGSWTHAQGVEVLASRDGVK